MTQKEFNIAIAEALYDLGEAMGLVRPEPKHAIEGDELQGRIFKLFCEAEKVVPDAHP